MPRDLPKIIDYSDKYCDDNYEYRHVTLNQVTMDKKSRLYSEKELLSEQKWRSLGILQGEGWQNYAVHAPEPHIMLFRRRLTDERGKEEKEE